jgi:hypothetical protein
MTKTTMEWAPFRVRPGVTEAQLLAASAHLQSAFVARQEGFINRRLVRTSDGGYVDIIVWASAEAADRAMQNAAKSDTCSSFFALMEADSAAPGAGVSHLDVIAEY